MFKRFFKWISNAFLNTYAGNLVIVYTALIGSLIGLNWWNLHSSATTIIRLLSNNKLVQKFGHWINILINFMIYNNLANAFKIGFKIIMRY